MGNCMSRPRLWGEGATTIGLRQLMRHVKPGDIILFDGEGIDAYCIQFMSANDGTSHAGIVLRADPSDPKSRLLVGEAYLSVIGPDYYRGKSRHSGFQVVDLETRLATYRGHVSWRPINPTREHPNFVALQESYKKFLGNLPQPIAYVHFDLEGIKRFIEIGLASVDDHDNRNMEVCNTMVAHSLYALGVIKAEDLYRLDNITLACFGSTYGQLPFRPGWQMGELHKLVREDRFDEAWE